MRPIGPRGGPKELTEEEKKNRPKITKALLSRIFSYLKPYRLHLAAVMILIIVAGILGVFPSIFTGRMIDEGLYGGNLELLIRYALLSLLVLVLSNLVGAGEVMLTTWIGQFITFDMRNKMYAHLQKMGHLFYTANRQGDIITRMTEDIGGVQHVIANTLVHVFSNVATVVIVVVTLFQKNWILALVGVAILPLLVIPTRAVGKKRWKIAEETQRERDKSNQILNETLSVSGQLLVKLFTRESQEYAAYQAVNLRSAKLAVKERLVGVWFWRSLRILHNMGPLILYVVAGFLIYRFGDQSLTVGDVTVMVALLNKLYHPMDQLLNVQADVIRSMALFTRIFSYFDLEPAVKNPSNGYLPQEGEGIVEFQNVAFSYSEEKPLLQEISFKVEKGKTVAIVGKSGSGKSTLVNLLPRLYDTEEGAVLVDGVDVRNWDLYALRRQFGAVTQETYLFNDTIRQNLLYAKEDATDEELIAACKDANIHDFICALPQGYDTMVGNRGFKLSGGEKQRISIARAMLKNPKILILDEATSSLDSISEDLIRKAMDPLLHGRTSIVIAHRLTTILAADEILVMQEGRIVERGKHQELVERDGVYKELYETQFRYALDDYEARKEGKNQ